MIVKNEEATLAALPGSVADLVDEIVVVDTGSTDATAAVAARFGARVYPFHVGGQLRRGAQRIACGTRGRLDLLAGWRRDCSTRRTA